MRWKMLDVAYKRNPETFVVNGLVNGERTFAQFCFSSYKEGRAGALRAAFDYVSRKESEHPWEAMVADLEQRVLLLEGRGGTTPSSSKTWPDD